MCLSDKEACLRIPQKATEQRLSNEEGTAGQVSKGSLFAYHKAGTILSILKAKFRRVLGVKPKKRTRYGLPNK